MTKHEQTVLITGAASGIGEAIARALAGREYRVFGSSRRPDSVERRPGIEMLALDVRDPDSVRRCIQEVIERAGAIDVLINNAGYALMGGVEESSEAEIAAQFDTNFYGVVRLTQAVLPHMRARGNGRILNLSSLAGRVALPFNGIYSASKFALEGYSEALYHELKPLGIHVSLIEPGFMRTSLAAHGAATRVEIVDYDLWRRQALESIQDHLAKAPGPETVAKTVLRALDANNPALRYPCGPDARLVTKLQRLLPEKIFARVMRREFGLHQVGNRTSRHTATARRS
jgi:short-subunit dehydrogenase